MATLTATLEDGFSIEIDDSFRDDFELLEAFAAVADGDVTRLPRVMARTLGAENTKKLKEHIRNDKGIVQATAMYDAFQALIASTAPGKK